MENLNEYARLIIMAIASIIALFIISKILGKKQIAQLEFIDYIIGISIGSIAAEMATDVSDKPIQYYLISMLIFFLVDVLFTYVSRKQPFFKHFFKGNPLTLINEGKIDYAVLKKSKLDVNDLLALCRNKGYFDIADISYAVLENNGQISILPRKDQAPVVLEDITQSFPEVSLPTYLVIDGKIVFDALEDLKKDTDWLLKRLNVNDVKELDKIILVIYDTEKDEMNVHYK